MIDPADGIFARAEVDIGDGAVRRVAAAGHESTDQHYGPRGSGQRVEGNARAADQRRDILSGTAGGLVCAEGEHRAVLAIAKAVEVHVAEARAVIDGQLSADLPLTLSIE